MAKNMSGHEEKMRRILRRRAFDAQNGLCYWCRQPMNLGATDDDPMQATGDHLVPLHNGGKTVPGNIVAACRKCNNERHPELASMGGGVVAKAGDDSLRSPFEALRVSWPGMEVVDRARRAGLTQICALCGAEIIGGLVACVRSGCPVNKSA